MPTPILDKLTKDPFIGDLPNDHIFKAKQEELKRLVLVIKSLPHASAGLQLEKYWTTLKELGDPIADTALNIHFNRRIGRVTVARLKLYLGDVYIRKSPPKANELTVFRIPSEKVAVTLLKAEYIQGPHIWVNDHVRKIQIAVAVLHWNESAKDKVKVIGKLNPKQIAAYHHKIFNEFGMPNQAFGGTPITGIIGFYI